jgi:hypothetical protein
MVGCLCLKCVNGRIRQPRDSIQLGFGVTKRPAESSPTHSIAIGWAAVGLLALASSFWSFWGGVEAFHEGWCRPTLAGRLLQTLFYLLPAMVLITLTGVSLAWPKLGATALVVSGIAIGVWVVATGSRFSWFILSTIVFTPILVGGLVWFGDAQPRKWAWWVGVGIPLAIGFFSAAEPTYRVSQRYDDGDRGLRTVVGNGVRLQWAPAGPGWTREGKISWDDAIERVRFLSADGLTLTDTPVDLWRLPSREEVVRSLTRRNQNAGGTWDPATERAEYQIRPDKESPIWDPYAPLIYLWTSEPANPERAWIVVYHGGVFSKTKRTGSPSIGIRAVRVVPLNE